MDMLTVGMISNLKKDTNVKTSHLEDVTNTLTHKVSNLETITENYQEVDEGAKPLTSFNFETVVSFDQESVSHLARSWDGNLYGIRKHNDSSKIFKSEDSGNSFIYYNPVYDLQVAHGAILHMTVFPNGEMVLITANGKALHFEHYSDAEYTVALTTGIVQSGDLSISTYSKDEKNIVLYGEYTHTNEMKKLWISHDCGRTYQLLKNGDTLNAGNNHWHCAVYDPYSDGIWATQGDLVNKGVYYTPDYGNTWHFIPGYQPTSIYCFPDRVIFGRDSSGLKPGISQWIRSSEQFPTQLTDALTFRDDLSADKIYPDNIFWNEDSNDYYVYFRAQDSAIQYNYIYGTGDGGQTWHLVSKINRQRERDIRKIFGIDKNGYMFFMLKDGLLLRAKTLQWN